MTLVEQVYAQTLMLSGSVESDQEKLLGLFCRSAVVGMEQRLRDGITPEDCKADFIAAGALYALAALAETDVASNVERLQFADVTLVPGGTSAASRCLRRQADMIISPYCKDGFVFRGV